MKTRILIIGLGAVAALSMASIAHANPTANIQAIGVGYGDGITKTAYTVKDLDITMPPKATASIIKKCISGKVVAFIRVVPPKGGALYSKQPMIITDNKGHEFPMGCTSKKVRLNTHPSPSRFLPAVY